MGWTVGTQKTEWNMMDRSLTKNTKNETKRNVDGTIGKITKENGTILLEALVLEQNRTISKKSERAQAYLKHQSNGIVRNGRFIESFNVFRLLKGFTTI